MLQGAEAWLRPIAIFPSCGLNFGAERGIMPRPPYANERLVRLVHQSLAALLLSALSCRIKALLLAQRLLDVSLRGQVVFDVRTTDHWIDAMDRGARLRVHLLRRDLPPLLSPGRIIHLLFALGVHLLPG